MVAILVYNDLSHAVRHVRLLTPVTLACGGCSCSSHHRDEKRLLPKLVTATHMSSVVRRPS
jgi:hypothetical protein